MDSDRSCSAYKTLGRMAENITNIHQCLHSLFLHPFCRLHSLLFLAWWQLCCHYGVEIAGSIQPKPAPCPYQCCWQGQPMPRLPERASANQKLLCFCPCRVVLWRFPMGDLVMPIKMKNKRGSFYRTLKINISSCACLLIIHWHSSLPHNNTAWTAAPVPSTPQPGREKGGEKVLQ